MGTPGRKPKPLDQRKGKLDVSLEPNLLKTLNELAHEWGTSRTKIVEDALREYFQKHGIAIRK